MMDGWIVGLGEVLWDVFRDGPVFGGAPANFACHARALGGQVAMVSAVGPDSDPLSQPAIEALVSHGVETRWLQRNTHETGRVIVDVDDQGQPTYTFSENPAWDAIQWNDQLVQLAGECRAVCFGTLAQRAAKSQATIMQFLKAVPPETLRVFDVNLRVTYWSEQTIAQSLAVSDVLKLNEDELPIVLRACAIGSAEQLRSEEELRLAIETLRRKFDLQLIALTRGSRGATLVTETSFDHCAPPSVTIRDTVGAGDAFTAAMLMGWMKDWPLTVINQRATEVAAFVCTQSGATPRLPAELIAPFTHAKA